MIKLVNFKEEIEKTITTAINDTKFTNNITSFVKSHNFMQTIKSDLYQSEKIFLKIKLTFKVLESRLYPLVRDKVDAVKKNSWC